MMPSPPIDFCRRSTKSAWMTWTLGKHELISILGCDCSSGSMVACLRSTFLVVC